jgi:hypothetical protein
MYKAIKAAAPDKLVTIAFQDDQSLYNGTLIVTDKAGQNPPTIFNNVPVEQAISSVVDVWGLNIYSGMSGDFVDYQTNVINAANGAYARPLWVTEWGIPSGKNFPAGEPGPDKGNATAAELSPQELASGAASIAADISYMHTSLGFVAGAFYFEYSDEWWKNIQGSPIIHDGGVAPDWPEESWGLYGVAVSGDREDPQIPDPNHPDILTARQPYVDAVKTGYATLAAAYANETPGPRRDEIRSQLLARSYGHIDTEWGVMHRVPGTLRQWQLDPFGAVEVLKNRTRGLTVRLLEWDNQEAFLPRDRPEIIRFLSTGQRHYVQEDANAVPPRERIPIFQLIPPAKAQFSELEGPFEEPPIPSAPVSR